MAAPGTSDDDDAALRLVQAKPGAALCTIVGIDGSYSRRLGAQLAVSPDGEIAGSLADGCLESELANQALARRGQRPQVLRYGRGSPFIDFRLPCGSGLDVLVDPSPDRRAIARTVQALDARRPALLSLPVERAGLLLARGYIPPPRILVFGMGPEADWLTWLATGLGYDSRLISPRADLALCRNPAPLPVDDWTAIVLLFHDHAWEQAILDWALSTQAMYVGAIGGAVARGNRVRCLLEHGQTVESVARLRSPIGLIKRTREARVMAVSIIAEIVEIHECLKVEQP